MNNVHRSAAAAGLVELELKCCCCGTVLDRLLTPWLVASVRPESVWTRDPCMACEIELEREDRERARRTL